jgi:hypothetical protein
VHITCLRHCQARGELEARRELEELMRFPWKREGKESSLEEAHLRES